MAERTIVGVDFSGAGEDNAVGKTWVTQAFLDTEEDSLILLSCKPTTREHLTGILKELPHDAVAALDFPFGVPIAFTEFIGLEQGEMPALWKGIAEPDMSFEKFEAERDKYVDVEQNGETLRAGDLHVPGCASCLHKIGSPNMLPMTFRGMQMLNTLWNQTNCQVPPLKEANRKGAVLLEAMPGAALKEFNLPDKGFKGGKDAFEKRRKILKELPKCSNVTLINLPDFRDQCMFSDDALDSIVAAVVAALWAMDKSESAFKKPSKHHTVANAFAKYQGNRKISSGISHLSEDDAARKEGWIYVPKLIQK